MKNMKGYGFKDSMNPQTKMKKDMMPSKSKGYAKPDAKGKAGHDMSPPEKKTPDQPIWQNMR